LSEHPVIHTDEARGDASYGLMLPTTRPRDILEEGLRARAPWFYPLRFANGATTESITADIAQIHTTCTDAIFSHLDRLFGHRWETVRALDIACHEGWFSFQTAARGAASVLGYDIRPEHIAKAQWLREVTGLTNTHFEVRDLFALDPSALGTFELVFFVGIFYHLENPMAALRIARSLTQGVCVLEGQVARQQEIATGWGPVGMERHGPGMVVLPGEPVHAHQPAGVVLVPTLEALRLMLLHAGFREVHLLLPAPHAYVAFQTYDRVMLFAYT
jgi:tRNA (mo5U34)-methyltransferase